MDNEIVFRHYFDQVGQRVQVDGRAGTIVAVAVTLEGVPVYQELGGYFYVQWDDHGAHASDDWEQKVTGNQLNPPRG